MVLKQVSKNGHDRKRKPASIDYWSIIMIYLIIASRFLEAGEVAHQLSHLSSIYCMLHCTVSKSKIGSPQNALLIDLREERKLTI